MCPVEKHLRAPKDWGLQHFLLQPLLLMQRFVLLFLFVFLFFLPSHYRSVTFFVQQVSQQEAGNYFCPCENRGVKNKKIKLTSTAKQFIQTPTDEHVLSVAKKFSILDRLLMWSPMGVWYKEINYRSHWPHWPHPNPLLSNLPGAHNELSHSLSLRNWSRRVKRSSKVVSDATWGAEVRWAAGQSGCLVEVLVVQGVGSL